MFEGLFQPMHLLVILIIAMFVFGPKRLSGIGKGLGDSIRQFKEAIKDHDPESAVTKEAAQPVIEAGTSQLTR
jgi:twin arginine-targeting protein translocase, TatA/E family